MKLIDGSGAKVIKKEYKENIASFLALKYTVVRPCSPHSCKEQQWKSDTHISRNRICFDNFNLFLLPMQLNGATSFGFIKILEKHKKDAHSIKSKIRPSLR